MRHSVTSPGSRNAPLALTLAELTESVSVIDERSAGFFALGMAKASGRPVAVTCTSGTAAANLLPAVTEAREARIPLIVLTADRPPELREVGAGQSIDQLKIFGSAVKWFVEVGNHEPGRDSAVHHRALACRAFHTAVEGRPAPVHLNFGLREPLAPVAGGDLDFEDWRGREDGRPWTERPAHSAAPAATHIQVLAERIAQSPRGALVCGPVGEDVAEPAARVAALAGWALLAEPTSGVRCGEHDRSHVVAHYDALLRSERFAGARRADLVLRIGDTPTSKPLRAWLTAAGRQIVVDPHAAWHEPSRLAAIMLGAAPAALCDAIAGTLASSSPDPDPAWLGLWLDADREVAPALGAAPDPFEPKAYAALADALPDDATVWIASSMPVRDVETFFPSVATPIRLLSNRGANGIDGTVSSAVGAALASGGRCHLLAGELALLHDLGGLVAAADLGAELTIVCVNNGGGGIFDFLPLAAHADADVYEQHVATPRAVDLGRMAALGGLAHTVVRTPDEVRDAAAEPGLIELRTDRADSVAWHRDVFARVEEAIS